MDRGLWAIWYDLPEAGKEEYLTWLHETHIRAMLRRPGYLWAAHIENVMTAEREQSIHQRLVHTQDPAVPAGNAYLMLYGAEHPHVFLDPRPSEVLGSLPARSQEMLGLRTGVRYCIFAEAERADGPEVKSRAPGVTPGPVIQMGTFNANAPENDEEIRSPHLATRAGGVTARRTRFSAMRWPGALAHRRRAKALTKESSPNNHYTFSL